MIRNTLIFIFLISSFSLQADKPALILQVTVDQLRGDMLTRFGDRFGDGGFRYLADNGTVYADAQFRHANTMTAAGHATLATGGNAAQHGMVANEWYDRGRGEVINSVQDDGSPYIEGSQGYGIGRSPRNLASSTFSDELVLASGGKSRAFGVSTKDRGAIITAGHRGQAYWYSSKNGEYITTSWYRDRYPGWVKEWNARKLAAGYAGRTWDLVADRDSYVFKDRDDRPFEVPRGELGRTFPHTMAGSTDGGFFTHLRYTPWADELILSFTEALIEHEGVGQRGHTDYLSVSFSATDHIGHAYGPNSLEAEDNLLRLDRILARLLAAVDAAVGLDRTLVVLSADHGVQSAPEHMSEHGIEAGRLATEGMEKPINEALSTYFQTSEKLVAKVSLPGVYFDYEALKRAGVSRSHAEAKLARDIVKTEGIGVALTRSDLLSGELPDTPMVRLVLNSFHSGRSGDLYIMADPFWFFGYSTDGDAATHGSRHMSDRFVPLIFAGPGMSAQTVYRRVAPRDVAPTLSAIMGVLPPSGSTGQVLSEVVGD